jgi:hypothetical protein
MKTASLCLLATLAAFGAAVPAAAEVTSVTCESKDKNERVCTLPKNVNQVVMRQQLSDKDCTRGRNWDVRKKSGNDELWVRNGCRGEFEVRYGNR